MGVTDFEFNLILGLLQRVPTHTELGMFAVMWSEHCGYKFSRPVLARFKKYKEAMDGDGLENAGIVPIGGGLGITMKVESHNHPSAVEPYQGAATGVGGILRDIFTMGARPIACMNSLRFGPIVDGEASPEVVQRNRYLFRRVVAGIGGYGNCVGVPTVGGEVFFHTRYSGNPLVNAMAVGILKLDEVTTAGAAGIGNPVIYLGSSTGKDGIHGATFASDTLGEDNEAKRPNVQIGDPFAEKLLIEATLEALKTGAVVAIQDMGAAGLTCSTIEMSSKGGVGMDVNLDLVPAREDRMTGYELMLSESQERMLAVAHLGREHEVIDVFKKWGIHAVVIGTVTNTGVVKITRNGIVEAEVNPKLLTDHCPTYRVESEIPDYYFDATEFEIASVKESDTVEALKTIVASPNIASKRWVFQQYDQEVQTQTAVLPGQGDAAVLALRGTQKAISLSIDGNGRQVYFDPYVGGLLAVCEAARNVACTGAKPVAATDGLNFGNPQLGHIYWQFDQAVRGIAEAAEALHTPVISGNVSFYNQSDLGEVYPTPLIGMLGLIEDASSRKSSIITSNSCLIVLVYYGLKNLAQEGLGASEYLATVLGIENGRPVAPHLESELKLCDFLVEAAATNEYEAAHDCSEGGFALTIAELCMVSQGGAKVSAVGTAFDQLSRNDARLFGELPGRVVLAVDPQKLANISALASSYGLMCESVGEFAKNLETLQINEWIWNVQELNELFEGTIPSIMSGR